jgi:hypothetical protein
MKKLSLIVAVLVIANITFGTLIDQFRGWNDLIDKSHDIIIAKCTATLGTTKPEKLTIIIDGVIPSDIQVISVLKGNTKVGPSHMASQYWPYQGEKFLLFANYRNDQYYTGYNAVEAYRVIPLNRHFQTNELSGKSLNEQIQLMLSQRLADINDELQRDTDEKKRIEEGFKKK